MKKVFTAATVEEAKSLAAAELGKAVEEISFTVLEEPKKSFFGKLKGEAKVEAEVGETEAAVEEVKAPVKILTEAAPVETAPEEAAPAEEEEPKVIEWSEASVKKAECAKNYLLSIIRTMGIEEVEIRTEKLENGAMFVIESEEFAGLIGKKGELLDSLQYLTSLVVNKGQENYIRVKLDTEDYRRRRKDTLENLAKGIAYKVKKSRRPVVLEPMNPYERRIIHSALQGDPFVTTYSEGEEPNRKVVVALKKDADLDALDRKYGERRSRGGYRNSRGKGGRGDRRGSRRQNRESGNEMAEYIEPVQIPDAPAENSGETFTEE